jgi:HPt (histidine-containing phosphotransfer) domain-containing protein
MASDIDQVEPLYSNLGGDLLLAEIVDMFVDEMPDRVEKLLELLSSGDLEGLRRTAHQLRGAAGSYGFETITPCAAEVEDSIRAGEPEEAVRLAVEQLVELCNRVRHMPHGT